MVVPARCRTAALLLAGLTLVGSGAQRTEIADPAYRAPTTTAAGSGFDRYAGVQVRFTKPALRGVDRQVVKSYIAFHVATLRTWRSGHAVPALSVHATPAVRTLITEQIPTQRELGVVDQPSIVHIRRVVARNGVAGLAVCTEAAGTARPLVVAMTDLHGTWKVSAIAPPKKPFPNCDSPSQG
jgi:hypothetical protein